MRDFETEKLNMRDTLERKAIKDAGYRVCHYNNGLADVPGAWVLVDPDGAYVGGVFDTRWEAEASALSRL